MSRAGRAVCVLFIDWRDGSVEDTDEVVVRATKGREIAAVLKAVESWVEANRRFPGCRLDEVRLAWSEDLTHRMDAASSMGCCNAFEGCRR